MATRKLVVEVVGDSSSLERAFRRSGAASKGFGRDIESASRGALAATLSFRGLGRALTFAAAPFLVSGGLVAALKSTVTQAEESQRVLGQTANAVRQAGLSWQTYAAQVQKAALAQANVSGFDDERLLGTFTGFLRVTGDVNKALRDNALAANVARGRNIDLEQAAGIVTKAELGMAGALRRVGIDAQKGAKPVQLLALLQQKFAGSAEAFGRTAAGAQARFNVALGNTQEAIGTALLPTLTKYLNAAADWLSQSKNQERIQRDVTKAVEALRTILSGIVGVIRTVDRVTGSFQNTLKLLIGLKVASIVAGWTRQIRLLTAASVTAAGAGGVAGLVVAIKRLAAIGTLSIAFKFPGLAEGLLKIGGLIKLAAKLGAAYVAVNEAVKKIKPGTGFDFSAPTAKDVLGAGGFPKGTELERAFKLGLAGVEQIGPVSGKVGLEVGKAFAAGRKKFLENLKKAAKQAGGSTADAKEIAASFGQGEQIALAVQQARTAIVRGDEGAQQALVAALKARVAFDRRYEKIQQDLIRRGVGDVKQHAKILKQLLADEADALSEIAAVQKQGADAAKQAAAAAKQAAADARQATIDALQNMQDLATQKLSTAQTTRGIQDDLRAFADLEAALKARIKAEGRTADLLRQLGDLRRQRAQTRQFAALGLDPTGGDFAPTVASLRKQLGGVTDAIQGSFLDTGKTEGMLKRIRTVLAGGLGSITDDVRRKIKEMLDGINDELKSGSSKVAHTSTTTLSPAILAGLDLPRDQLKLLRSRLSRFNSAGLALGPTVGRQAAFGFAVPAGVVVESTVQVNLDGRQITTAVTRGQQRNARRNPGQRRGQNPL